MKVKLDNAYTRDKIDLRINHLPAGAELTVLDCFAGDGIIWRGVERLSGRAMRVLPIDVRADVSSTFRLDGRNEDFLVSLDLRRFDVIDLDAYGVPYEQLRILFERKYIGTVFVTFIQVAMGKMPFSLLQDIGFSREMIDKSSTLFARRDRAWGYFCEWLALHGVNELHVRSKMEGSRKRKYYIAFRLNAPTERTAP